MIFTFLANQVPLAGVIHSLAWIPVSIQIPGRFGPPVLNYTCGGKTDINSESKRNHEHVKKKGLTKCIQ